MLRWEDNFGIAFAVLIDFAVVGLGKHSPRIGTTKRVVVLPSLIKNLISASNCPVGTSLHLPWNLTT